MIKERPCQYCWETFIPARAGTQKYCSTKCSNAQKKEKQREKCRLAIVEGESNHYLKTRFTVFRRDKFTCRYCGRTIRENISLHIDHIIPDSKGGLFRLDNLVTACNECNEGKKDVLLEVWEMKKLRC